MIAVDASALMAIVLNEPEADACITALTAENDLVISAGTLAELLIVAARRNVGEEIARLIDGLQVETVNVTSPAAHRIAEAYKRWGRGTHRAALNFGDCFAYDVAKHQGPLMFVGDDFSQTDVESVL